MTTKNERPQTLHRGAIWYVKSDPKRETIGSEMWADRPAVIISNDILNKHSDRVTIVYLSSSPKAIRSVPTHITFTMNGHNRPSTVLCEQVYTVDTSRLVKYMGEVPKNIMSDINDGVRFALALTRNGSNARIFHKWESYINDRDIDINAETNALLGEVRDKRIRSLERAIQLLKDHTSRLQGIIDNSSELSQLMYEVNNNKTVETSSSKSSKEVQTQYDKKQNARKRNYRKKK